MKKLIVLIFLFLACSTSYILCQVPIIIEAESGIVGVSPTTKSLVEWITDTSNVLFLSEI